MGVSRGNTIRGKRNDRLRGKSASERALRGSLRGRVSEVFRVFSSFERV